MANYLCGDNRDNQKSTNRLLGRVGLMYADKSVSLQNRRMIWLFASSGSIFAGPKATVLKPGFGANAKLPGR
jgi:hypothetical protein